MVHPDNNPKAGVKVPEKVNEDAKPNEVRDNVKKIVVAINVRQQFTNEMNFTSRLHLFEWIQIEASKFGFDVVIARSDNGSSRRQEFVVMTCERSGKYVPKVQTLKHDDTKSRKCVCPFKLCASCRINGLWCFSVICGIHNHALDTKLQGHPIVCRLKSEEKEFISELSIIKVASRNILVDLKRKDHKVFQISGRYTMNVINRASRKEV
ncbi:uncharacterized protein LOC131655402 [Vicia villosa]|uniref:uncharacterized protein LOC131655402 n=1 Tax=Vicia villosa TaxID=3911 RepID=UPI00273CF076|nr:uncharacterized protein LOC131655402 [Vicia villosa]